MVGLFFEKLENILTTVECEEFKRINSPVIFQITMKLRNLTLDLSIFNKYLNIAGIDHSNFKDRYIFLVIRTEKISRSVFLTGLVVLVLI